MFKQPTVLTCALGSQVGGGKQPRAHPSLLLARRLAIAALLILGRRQRVVQAHGCGLDRRLPKLRHAGLEAAAPALQRGPMRMWASEALAAAAAAVAAVAAVAAAAEAGERRHLPVASIEAASLTDQRARQAGLLAAARGRGGVLQAASAGLWPSRREQATVQLMHVPTMRRASRSAHRGPACDDALMRWHPAASQPNVG